jgi:hypothetical protein
MAARIGPGEKSSTRAAFLLEWQYVAGTLDLLVVVGVNDGRGRLRARLPVATMMSKNLP